MSTAEAFLARIQAASVSDRKLMTLSARDLRILCQVALRADEVLGDINTACRNAIGQGTALDPNSLLNYLTDNNSHPPQKVSHGAA